MEDFSNNAMGQEPQIPQDLENQLAGPGGQFPGTAETLATPVGSDKPVRVKIGQADNRHLQLSREEFRARSAKQREIDAQTGLNADPVQDPQLGTNPSAAAKNTAQTKSVSYSDPASVVPTRRKPGRPKGGKGKALRVAPKSKPVGQPCPAPSTTEAPIPPIPIPTDAMLEQRMSRLERGMDMIVQAIAERDAVQEPPFTQPPDPDDDQVPAELDEELEDDLDELGTEPEPNELSASTLAENEPEWDKGLQELQQMIVKRNPLKRFRQFWCQQSRAAQYNEWPPERREAFDEVFNSMVAHPKFVHQMSTFLRGSRSGNCIGNEQIARVCTTVAGFLAVYQLAAAGR